MILKELIKQHQIMRNLLITAGIIFTAVGAIGIFIPVLPTTPFLLLAAGCFVRSSQKAYNWLLSNKFFGAYLKNYLEKRGMTLRMKVSTIVLMWIAIILSINMVIDSIAISILFIALAVGVTVHLITIKNIRE
ncbi:YbaN family protein [Chloroflexota bacterium]